MSLINYTIIPEIYKSPRSVSREAEDISMLDTSSNHLVDLILKRTTGSYGLHLETSICAAASLAGVLLLRETGFNFSGLKEGAPFYMELVEDSGICLFNFMRAMCHVMGIDPGGNWSQPVPEWHCSLKAPFELVQSLERPAARLLDNLDIPLTGRARVAALATVKLIRMSQAQMNLEISKSLAYESLMKASRTVPAQN